MLEKRLLQRMQKQDGRGRLLHLRRTCVQREGSGREVLGHRLDCVRGGRLDAYFAESV